MEELVAVVKGNISDFQAKMNQVSSKLENVSKKFKDIGETASKFVTLPVLAAGAASFKMASDYQESLNKVDVAFKDSADEVKKWSETTLKAFGIASGTALDMAALYGDMATSMGFNSQQAAKMSIELVGLAGDMASFKNISIDVANIALKSIFTGETESLKTLGIVMTEANIKAYMLSQGIKTNYDTMDQAQKVAIRYQYVMAQTANSQGDFARTGGGAANQMRILGESLKEIGVSFGQVLLPVVTNVIKRINGWLESLQKLSPETKKIIVVVAALAAAVGPLLISIGFLTSTIIPALVAGGAAVSAAWLPITAIIVGITGAILLFNSAAKETEALINRLSGESTEVLNKRLTELNGLLGGLESLRLKELKKQFDENKKALEGLTEVQRLSSPLFLKQTELIKKINEEENIYNANLGLVKKYKAEKEAIEQILKERKKLSQSVAQVSTLPTEQVREEGLTAIKPKELGKNALTKDLKVTAEALRDLKKEYISITEVSENFGGVVEKTFTSATSSIKGVIVELQEFSINMNAIFEDLAESTITAFATEIGNVLGGGDFGLDRILTMFADWAIKLGSILIAAGISIEAFKDQALSNPLGVVALGAALVAAGAAVKSAVQTNPTSSSGAGSSSGGGRDNWDAFGERNLRGAIKVEVNGTLSARGNELLAVINKENKRLSL